MFEGTQIVEEEAPPIQPITDKLPKILNPHVCEVCHLENGQRIKGMRTVHILPNRNEDYTIVGYLCSHCQVAAFLLHGRSDLALALSHYLAQKEEVAS